MTPVHTFILDAHKVVLTVNLTQDTPLQGESKHSGAPCRIGKKIEKNAKFQAKFKF
jgi:hypothetical protein